ncbi:MAG TPA: rhodanese-like domain-containing protein [Candidatus Kapabacteria bacterium]
MKRFIGIVAALGLFVSSCSSGNTEGYKNMSVASADSLIKADTNVLVLDVRTPDEYSSETGHLKNAKLLPVDELEGRIGELNAYKSKTVVTYCRSGSRSAKAADILTKKGFKVVNVEGGISSWNESGLPAEKGTAQ